MKTFACVIAITATIVAMTACQGKDKSDSTSSGGGAATVAATDSSTTTATTAESTTPPAVAGTLLALGSIEGEILPKESANPATATGALVVAEGHPEISATTDGSGKFAINNVLPGTVSLFVSSNDGSGLHLADAALAGPSAFGLKIPDVLIKSGTPTELGQKVLKKTGGVKAKVVFYSNPNNLDLTGSDVFVPGTSFIAKTDKTGAFTLSGLPPGSYSLRAEHTGFAVLDRADVTIAEGETTDLGELALSLSNGPEGGITALADASAKIGGVDHKVSTSRTVAIKLNYDNDAALMKISDEPSFLNKEWKPVAKTAEWKFTSDGAKSLYVTYSDLNGLESSPYSDEFYVDTEAPVLSGITIMNDWVSSATLNVYIDVAGSDTGTGIADVSFKNESGTFVPADAWLPFKTPIDWTLSAGANGPRTVYAQVRDYAGHVSNVVFDQINKDTVTRYAERVYGKKLVFSEAQSPFFFNSVDGDKIIVISDEVEIGSGVTFTLNGGIGDGHTLSFRNKVTALGTAAKPIVMQTDPAVGCYGEVSLANASDGISEENHLDHVTFTRLFAVHLNGGLVENGNFNFDGACAVGSRGRVEKTGTEALVVRNNTYTNWFQAIRVMDGTNATTFENNSGTVVQLFVQDSPATGTVISGGTWGLAAVAVNVPVAINSGDSTISGLTFNGSNTWSAIQVFGPGTTTIQNVILDNWSTGILVNGTTDIDVNISGTTIRNSVDGITSLTNAATSVVSVESATLQNLTGNGLAAHNGSGTLRYKPAGVTFTSVFKNTDVQGSAILTTY